MTNEELALRIQAGETELIEQLWSQVRGFVAKKALRYELFFEGRNGTTADDLIQSAFEWIYKAVETYSGDVKFLTWYDYFIMKGFKTCLGTSTASGRKAILNNCGSLNEPIRDINEEYELIDAIPDEFSELPFEEVEQAEYLKKLQIVLNCALEMLNPRERNIFEMIGEGYTFEAIAQENNLSKQRVHQIFKKAADKIMRSHYAKELQQFL